MVRPDGMLINLYPNLAALLVVEPRPPVKVLKEKPHPVVLRVRPVTKELRLVPKEKLPPSGKLGITLPHASNVVTSIYMSQPTSFSPFVTYSNFIHTTLTCNFNPE